MRQPVYYEELKEIQKLPAPLPEAVGPLPNTGDLYPFNAAGRQQKPVNLVDFGYVEEECIVSGYANVYEYHDVGLYPKIRYSGGRYCTRILIRRPAAPQKQSDFAILEVYNYAGAERTFLQIPKQFTIFSLQCFFQFFIFFLQFFLFIL